MEEDVLNCPADLKDVREQNIIGLKKKGCKLYFKGE
jgi:hypothetical protein